MTSPTSVGSVSVEVQAEAKGLAKSLKKEIENAFRGLDLNAAIRDAVGKTRIKVPVEADFDTNSITEKVRRTRAPKVPVELDPVLAAFQAQVKASVASLSRESLKIPVDADAGRLRSELGAELAAIQAQAKIRVPTEPGAKAEYEAKLKAQLAEVAARVKQNVNVDVDTDGPGGVGAILKSIGGALPVIGGIAAQIGDLSQALGQAGSQSTQLGGSLAGAFTQATGPIGIVISLVVTALAAATAATAALAAAVTFLPPLFSAAAGAAAAIPAALVGVGAVFGTLSLGLKGISAAFKPKTGGGGGGGGGQDAAAQARQIAGAERGVEAARRGITQATRGLAAAQRGLESSERSLADAQQGVADAQKRAAAAQLAVNKARTEAKEDIEDLGRALRGAQLDEEGAALAVTDALRELNAAKLTGNIPDIQAADLAYRQAQLTLENAADSAQDLGEEQADANKKGVDGSDKVVSALDAQAQAQQGVKDAQEGVLDAQNGVLAAQDALLSANDSLKSSYDGLASAQDSLAAANTKAAGGAAGVGAEVVKLAPAAQRFVDAVKKLKPAFEGLRLDVQQRLFEGLDKTVTNLGNAWIPALKTTLGSYADTFNQFFKNLGTSITTPKFITDIQDAAEGARRGMQAIGDSLTQSLVPAFGALASAAGPFLTTLGREIGGIVTEFSNWVLEGEKTGGLKDFFATASDSLHDIFTTGKLVTKIVGDIIQIIIGGKTPAGKKSPLDNFNDKLQEIHEFLSDPANVAKIEGFFDNVKDSLQRAYENFNKLNSGIEKIGDLYDRIFPSTQEGEGKANSLGQTIGRALIAGIIAGIGFSMEVQTGILIDLFAGPNSFLGTVLKVFGIHSPSTVFAEIGNNLVDGLVLGVTGAIGGLVTSAGNIGATVIRTVGSGATWLVAAGKNAVIGFANGLVNKLGTLSTTAGSIRTTVQNRLSDAAGWLKTHGGNAVIGLANGIAGRLGTLSTYAGYMRTTVSNALSNAGSLLVSAGKNVINGLMNGISSRLGALGSFLGDVGSFIKAHKGPPAEDRVMLFGAGQLIMDGLIDGIGDKKAALAAQLSDVSGLVAGTAMPDLASDLGSVSGSLSRSAGLVAEARWAPGMTGDTILDALRGKIQFSYGGRVEKALSTA